MTAIDLSQDLIALGERARTAARMLAKLGAPAKDRALLNIADALLSRQKEVLGGPTAQTTKPPSARAPSKLRWTACYLLLSGLRDG